MWEATRDMSSSPGAGSSGCLTRPSTIGGREARMCEWAQASLTAICTASPRVDGKELPPKSWREPKPEYGDFQPVSSDPKNPWPACGPRNGLVGPLQGCGKPPGKVSSWGAGWVEGLALWPCQVSYRLEGSPSLGPGSCWMPFWSPRRMGRGEGFLRAGRLPGLSDPYSKDPDGGD